MTDTTTTKPTYEELLLALKSLRCEGQHYRNTGRGREFFGAALISARAVIERTRTATPRSKRTKGAQS